MRRRAVVKELFADAGVTFPPQVLMLRAFKQEDELEVWAAGAKSEPLSLVARYEICAASGRLGPKRREGDRQVPEGFYRIGFFNPKSSYHLSMQVSYPNASDRVLSDPKHPGGEIMIHGACASAGCLAMSDERIEELWVMARSAPLPIEVHIFPARDTSGLEADAERRAFWDNLEEGRRLFDRDGRLPGVRVDARGRYLFTPAP
jgi:murein L,D-transpeptidase YafK